MLNLKIPEDLQALYRSGEILAGMGYNSGGYMCRLIEHIATLTQQLAEAEAKVESLNKMRTHCENCGGDYLATGLELGCPCLLEARLKVLDNTLDVERDAFRNMQMQKEALEARNGRLADALKIGVELVSEGSGWGACKRMEGSQLYCDAELFSVAARAALAEIERTR